MAIKWTTYNSNNSGLASNTILSIAIDGEDNKWFGTTGSGVSKFDDSTWTTYNKNNSGLAHYSVFCIVVDSEGSKWFCNDDGSGVSKFDGNTWVTYNTSNSGLTSNNIISMVIDSEGNKWFGTKEDGVSKFDGASMGNVQYYQLGFS